MKKSEFKEKLTEAILDHLNQENVDEDYQPGTPGYTEFKNGMDRGALARIKGGKYVMDYKTQKDYYPKAFWQGYFYATGEKHGVGGAYDKINNWITTKLGQLGYSRTRGL